MMLLKKASHPTGANPRPRAAWVPQLVCPEYKSKHCRFQPLSSILWLPR
jgi:hypothetical protein